MDLQGAAAPGWMGGWGWHDKVPWGLLRHGSASTSLLHIAEVMHRGRTPDVMLLTQGVDTTTFCRRAFALCDLPLPPPPPPPGAGPVFMLSLRLSCLRVVLVLTSTVVCVCCAPTSRRTRSHPSRSNWHR